jgi:hypothetical protein
MPNFDDVNFTPPVFSTEAEHTAWWLDQLEGPQPQPAVKIARTRRAEQQYLDECMERQAYDCLPESFHPGGDDFTKWCKRTGHYERLPGRWKMPDTLRLGEAGERIAAHDRSIPRWWLRYETIRGMIHSTGHPFRSFVPQVSRD